MALSCMALFAGALAAPASASCLELGFGAADLVFADGFESGDAALWGSADPHYSATGIVDLEIETRFSAGLGGDHLLRLEVLTPRGHRYQTLSLPITFETSRRGSMRRVDGYPRPLAVRMVETTITSPSVGASFPVGGTVIVSSSLYGRWGVAAYFDDEASPCATAGFLLHP